MTSGAPAGGCHAEFSVPSPTRVPLTYNQIFLVAGSYTPTRWVHLPTSEGTTDTAACVTGAEAVSDSGISKLHTPNGWLGSRTCPSLNLLELAPSTVTASILQPPGFAVKSHALSGRRTQAETANARSVRTSSPVVVTASEPPCNEMALPTRPGTNPAPPASVPPRAPTESAALRPDDSSNW